MADQRIQYTENMVGAGHPTLDDTLNRLTLVEHDTDGTHKDITVLSINGTVLAETTSGFTIEGGSSSSSTLTVTGSATITGTPMLASGGTTTGPLYTRDDDGIISGGTWAIDYANGPVIKATAGANITSITMSNWPASGTGGHLRCMLVNFGAYTITFPSAWKWVKSDLTTTTTFGDLGLTLPASGTAIADLFSDDGGTTIYATILRG